MDFIGIGAQKSGTSWIYACLYEHHDICAPVKEIHFFSRPRFSQGQAWYEKHFSNCQSDRLRGEFSTSYLYSSESASRIAQMYPQTKIIAVLRNPVDRAYSQYRNAIKAGEIGKDMEFDDYVEKEPSCLEQGLYVSQLNQYYKNFPAAQILVMIYEDISKDSAAFMREIYSFLGVDSTFVPPSLEKRVNVARTPKAVWLERVVHHVAESLRKVGLDKLVWVIKNTGLPDLLRSVNTQTQGRQFVRTGERTGVDYFKNDVRELSKMLGRDLNKEWNI